MKNASKFVFCVKFPALSWLWITWCLTSFVGILFSRSIARVTKSSSGLANRPFQCLSQTKFLIPTSTNFPRPQFSHLMNGSLFLPMALVQVGDLPWWCLLSIPLWVSWAAPGCSEGTLTSSLLPSDYWNKAPKGTENYPRNLKQGKERKTEKVAWRESSLGP